MIVAPLALLAFADPKIHRRWGKIYFLLMFFLYLTGTYFTFTKHDLYTWEFSRNLSFNFFGFSMLIYAYRAIRLFQLPGAVCAEKVDYLLATVLTFSVCFMLAVALVKNTPMRIFTLAGIWLCAMEWKELRLGLADKPTLYRRHQRYILASYCYALTVLSIVHLKDELRSNFRWTWPTIVGVVLIWLLSAKAPAVKRRLISRFSQATLSQIVVRYFVGLMLMFAGYILYDLIYGPTLISQS